MLINQFNGMVANEAIQEAIGYYEAGGIPGHTIEVRFKKNGTSVWWMLRVDINRALPHQRKSILDAVARLEFQTGRLYPAPSDDKLGTGTVLFPHIHRVEPTLTAVDIVNIAPMGVRSSE